MGVGVGRWVGARVGASVGGLGAGAAAPRARPWPRGWVISAGLAGGAAAAVAGALAWAGAAPATSDVPAEMVRLLRFMALLKAAVPAGALAALVRRVRRPLAPGRLAAYAAGLWASAAGAALIAQLGHVGLGAALFHAGWPLMLAAAWRDDGLFARAAAGPPGGR